MLSMLGERYGGRSLNIGDVLMCMWLKCFLTWLIEDSIEHFVPALWCPIWLQLALFPGSSAWAEKKEPGTHCLRMLSSPRISGNLEIFRKICSVTLTSARYADFSCIKDASHWSHSVWTMTKEQQRYSALRLQKLCTRSCIPAKHCSTWLTQSLPLKFTDCFERSNADSYRRSDSFWLKKPPVWVSEGL